MTISHLLTVEMSMGTVKENVSKQTLNEKDHKSLHIAFSDISPPTDTQSCLDVTMIERGRGIRWRCSYWLY